MPGWEDSLKSREPTPDEVASQREEESRACNGSPLPGYTEEEKRLLQAVLRELMKKDGARYIVFREFLRRQGYLSIRNGKATAKPNWGFYSELAERWGCSPNTIKSWLSEALDFIVLRGREAVKRFSAEETEETER